MAKRIKKTVTETPVAEEKVAKKAVKKAVKKAAKKVIKKAAKIAEQDEDEDDVSVEKPATRLPLSKFVCERLLNNIPDEQIVQEMEDKYPDKDCTQKTVSWYRFAINKGRMEKAGFPRPDGGLINPRKAMAVVRKAEKRSKKVDPAEVVDVSTPVKKVAKKAAKKVSRRAAKSAPVE